jgi:DNA-binding NtrC family response regulator
MDTQAYLLRVLESGEFIRVGASKVQRTDVRIIAATNVNLEERVRKGKFREDLYYRLNTVPIKVPALHERREDIPVLFRKFSYDFAEKYRMTPIKLDDHAELILENYRWPGNIRELKNVAEQLSVLSEDRQITAESLQHSMPHLFKRHLPVVSETGREQQHGHSINGDFQERELLYKVLFDMKNDLNDLKGMFYELVRSNNLRMPDLNLSRQMQPSLPTISYPDMPIRGEAQPIYESDSDTYLSTDTGKITPIIIESGRGSSANSFENQDIEEEPLAMDEIEKEAIRRALKKYNGRRKEAAEELKISERTLYRKIKQYDL